MSECTLHSPDEQCLKRNHCIQTTFVDLKVLHRIYFFYLSITDPYAIFIQPKSSN